MITDEAKRRYSILVFWNKHGLEVTTEAFKVKKRTLYNWQAAYARGGSVVESLNPKSRAPINRRKRSWPTVVISEIRRVRTKHPNLGKEKVHVHLQAFCRQRNLVCPKVRTVGRLIADASDKMRTFPQKVGHNGQMKQFNRTKKTRKPKGFKALHPGQCIALDSIEFHFWGRRIYVITMIDVFSRYAFAHVTFSHASKAAEEFFVRCLSQFPYPVGHVLTDNGSEFMKDFDEHLRELCLTHWHTYPKTPKMNAHCERFNRTLQDEFFINHQFYLHNLDNCTTKLNEWLGWYNTDRPHHSLELLSPVQFLSKYNETTKITEECKM
jgi:transposase InsO family protein